MSDQTQQSASDSSRLHKGLEILYGREVGSRVPLFCKGLPRAGELPAVLFCKPASNQMLMSLGGQGYSYMRRFGMLPSAENPRWMLTLDNCSQAISGLSTFKPHSFRNSVVKVLAKAFVRADWPAWLRNTMLIASKNLPEIENLTRELTGIPEPGHSFCLGTPGNFSKLTVQISDTHGDVPAYIKVPLTDKAVKRVENEARFLERLGVEPAIRRSIPRRLHASKWGESFILFQESVPGAGGPMRLTGAHQQFLAGLRQIRSVRRSGLSLVQQVGDYFSGANFTSEMHEIGNETLREASLELASEEIECGITHGDFAPWNTSSYGSSLYVFDWEMASDDLPHVWDTLHYLAQTQSLLRAGPGPQRWVEQSYCSRGVYLLYLLYSATQLSMEASPSNGIAYRAALLRQALASSRLAGSQHLHLTSKRATPWKDDVIA
jgi:hypothetical protein